MRQTREKKPALKINFILFGIAGIMIVVGLIASINSRGEIFIPSPTSSQESTITFAPAATSTPFPYTIQEGDSLDAIAQRFNLGDDGPLLILDQNPEIMSQYNGVIFVGQILQIPVNLVTATAQP